MTLRKKTLLVIGVTLVSLIGVIYATSSTILNKGFTAVEEKDTRQNVQRVEDALNDDLAKLSFTARDWAEWDDTYAFIQDRNPEYIKTNLNTPTFARLQLNQMLYMGNSSQIVFATGFDLKRQQTLPVSPNLHKHLDRNSLLLRHRNQQSSIAGLVLLPEGSMLIASKPILNSAGLGPIQGTLLMGRYLDNWQIKQLSDRTHLSITIHRFDDTKLPPDFQAVRSALSKKSKIVVRPLNQETVAGYTLIQDIYGNPALIMRVKSPRMIYQQGQASINHLVISLIVVGLAFGLVTLLLLEKLILLQLSNLNKEIRSIGNSGNLSARVLSIKGKDELSSMASTINGMLEALEYVQNAQRESQRRYHRYNKVLAELAKRKMSNSRDLNASLREITKAAAHTLEVERVSIWLFTKTNKDQPVKLELVKQNIAQTDTKLPIKINDKSSDPILSDHPLSGGSKKGVNAIDASIDFPDWRGHLAKATLRVDIEEFDANTQDSWDDSPPTLSQSNPLNFTHTNLERPLYPLPSGEGFYRPVGFSRFCDRDLQIQLNCIEMYERSTSQYSQGTALAAVAYPAYFRALEKERSIAAHNAQTDLRTKELAELYLAPYGITSILDAPIWLGGQMVGVLCHDHIGEPRKWVLEEQIFAASVADLVSLVMEAYEHKQSEEALQKAYEELEIRVQERTAELAKANEELETEINERNIAEEKLLHDALHDSLTSLPNRSLFMEQLGYAIIRAKQRQNYLFAVLFLDLDRFKVVNDSLGHLIGDQLLIAFVRRLEVCLRPKDMVARLGGDEFVILLEDIKDINDATQIADRIQKELHLPFILNGHEIFITTSIGIALSTASYDQPEEILRDADTVMYRAKALGKARYEVFDKAMHERAVELLQLENDLRRVLERQELQICYQPIVALKTGRINGFEALVRWQHPQRGLVSPMDFIPIAEETGLIVPIGYWVLQEACCQIRAWQEHFVSTEPLTISVNFSGKQFAQPDFIQKIEQILTETGLDGHTLKLEITESVLIENAASAAAMFLQLKKLGVQVYIDDFGTGYSSLSYLHRFPIDVLKIDRSFVSRMSDNNNNSEIVRTIVTMADNLNMKVIAEGIETGEQLNQLREMRCEDGQGYLFAKPLTIEAVAALLAEQNGMVSQSLFPAPQQLRILY